MSVLVVIPARYGSTRFPGKPLAILDGKPMIQHVYERVVRAKGVNEVVVATDDRRIADAVKAFHGIAVMTSPGARSGTERATEVARSRRDQVIINVQGDEPLIEPDMIEQLAEYLGRHRAVPMASLMTAFARGEDMTNPNVVKVVTDRDGFALYFSRSPIPYVREVQGGSRLKAPESAGGSRLKAPESAPGSRLQAPGQRFSLEPRASSLERSSIQPPASSLERSSGEPPAKEELGQVLEVELVLARYLALNATVPETAEEESLTSDTTKQNPARAKGKGTKAVPRSKKDRP